MCGRSRVQQAWHSGARAVDPCLPLLYGLPFLMNSLSLSISLPVSHARPSLCLSLSLFLSLSLSLSLFLSLTLFSLLSCSLSRERERGRARAISLSLSLSLSLSCDGALHEDKGAGAGYQIILFARVLPPELVSRFSGQCLCGHVPLGQIDVHADDSARLPARRRVLFGFSLVHSLAILQAHAVPEPVGTHRQLRTNRRVNRQRQRFCASKRACISGATATEARCRAGTHLDVGRASRPAKSAVPLFVQKPAQGERAGGHLGAASAVSLKRRGGRSARWCGEGSHLSSRSGSCKSSITVASQYHAPWLTPCVPRISR